MNRWQAEPRTNEVIADVFHSFISLNESLVCELVIRGGQRPTQPPTVHTTRHTHLCEWVCLFCCPVLYEWNHTALQERYSSCILASSSSRASRGAFRTSLLAAVTLTPCGCATAAAGGSFAEAVRFNVAVHLGFRARRTPIAFAQMGMGL